MMISFQLFLIQYNFIFFYLQNLYTVNYVIKVFKKYSIVGVFSLDFAKNKINSSIAFDDKKEKKSFLDLLFIVYHVEILQLTQHSTLLD